MLKLFYKLVLFAILLLSTTLLYQKHTYAYHTLTQINPVPQTKILMEQQHYMDAYNYLNYFMQFDYMKENTEAHTLLAKITQKRSSLSYKSKKLLEGIRTGVSDEFIGQASAIGSDFFLIGDLRDLALEGTHYYKDEEVDTVLVSLSTIGLVASASTLFTLGSSAVAKSGVSMLKLAHKTKRIPSWLGKYLTRHAKKIRETKKLDSIKPLFNSLDTMYKRVGLNDTLKLLSRTHNLQELQSTVKLTKRYGKNTTTLLPLTKGKVLTEAKHLKQYKKHTVLLASTYGSSGLVHLIKGGEKNFIKTAKRMKAYAKVGYKGEAWKIFLLLMKYVSDTVLLILVAVSSILLLPLRKIISKKKFG